MENRDTANRDGIFMKTYKKVAISIVAGLLAMALSSAPMWWGVLFSSGGVVLRLKSLDFLLSLFQGE